MKVYKGVSIANGLGLGCLQQLPRTEIKIERTLIEEESLKEELELVDASLQKTIDNLNELLVGAGGRFSKDSLAIFEGQILLLEDEELKEEIVSLIKDKKYNALWATSEVFEAQISIVSQHKDTYLRERASDLRDLRDRLLNIMAGRDMGKTSFDEDVILFTQELTPSDTISLDLSHVKGFLTTIGGVTSHAAIISRTLGLPALVLSPELAGNLQEGEMVILNSFSEELYTQATPDEIEEYQLRYEKLKEEKMRLELLKDKDCQTKDGHKINLLANIGSPEDAQKALPFSLKGVGLFRSEFLFMGTSLEPSEEAQFEAYSSVVKLYAPLPVTIRTLDIGGDKEIPYLAIPKEENPFLGWRAVRMYKEKSSLVIKQIRAILRTSVFGLVKIMVPMVISQEEVLLFRRLVEEAQDSLKREGVAFNPENIKIGIMVETPATALIAETLAPYVDFFSLGTNDLTQYALAVDRGNPKVASLFSSYHPSVLKLINMTAQVSQVHKNVDVSVCGEFASDERGCLLIAGMGITNLSMTASLSLYVKDALAKVRLEELKCLAKEVVALGTAQQVVETVDEFRRTHGII